MPASPANATPAAPRTRTNREGPSPVHVLLSAVIEAMEAGVDQAEILTVLRFADSATGVDQAPVWRMLNGMLTTATAKATAAKAAQS